MNASTDDEILSLVAQVMTSGIKQEGAQFTLPESMIIALVRRATQQAYLEGIESGIAIERECVVNMLTIQHEAANGRHNYWQVAAQLIQAERS